MNRKEFYNVLNRILDDCGSPMPEGSKRRPFLAYSWKKYHRRNSLNLTDISKYKEISNSLKVKRKFGLYLGLMYHYRLS